MARAMMSYDATVGKGNYRKCDFLCGSTLGVSIMSGGGRLYPPEIAWQRVYEMKYQDAQNYLYQRGKRISAWETFIEAAPNPQYWGHLFYAWLASFAFALACCGVLLWWLGTNRVTPNNRIESDRKRRDASS